MAAGAGGMAGLRAAVQSLSRVELLAIAADMRAQAAQSEADARQLLLQYPALTTALLMVEERLGMLKTTTPALDAAAAAAGAGAGGGDGAAPAPAAGAPPTAAAAAAAAGSGADADDPVAMVRGILAMTDAAVAALPDDQRESAVALRDAVLLPLHTLTALPEPRRSELLELREQLRTTMGITPA